MSVLVEVIDRLQARGAMPAGYQHLLPPPPSAPPTPDPAAAPRFRLLPVTVAILATGAVGIVVWLGPGQSHRPDASRSSLAAAPAPAPADTAPGHTLADSSARVAIRAAASPAPPAPLTAVPPPGALHPSPVNSPETAAVPASTLPAGTAPADHSATTVPAPAASERDASEVQIHRSGSLADESADLARARQLAGRGRSGDAIELLQHHLTLWPAHLHARIALARLLHDDARTQDEAAVLREGLAIDGAHFAMPAAQLFSAQGRYADAIQALNSVPEDLRTEESDLMAAQAHRHLGQNTLAVIDLQQAIQRAAAQGRAPKPSWLATLGFVHEALAQPDQAIAQYRALLARNPSADDPSAQFARQRLQALAGSDRPG